MDFLFLVIIFFVVIVPLVLGIVIPIYKKHNNVTGNVVNYDAFMRKYVYKIYMSQEEIINTLKIKNDTDELSCTFDFDRAVILFSEYGLSKEYFFEIQECDGFSILKLNQVDFLLQNNISYKLNPFMVSKLNAEIVPFSQYEF